MRFRFEPPLTKRGGVAPVSLVRFKAQNHPQQATRDDVDDRATHPLVFDELDERFGPFDLDVAAAAHNTKCENYFDRATNGLEQPWRGTVWCNPPYSEIGLWVRKAWHEWNGTDGRMPDDHHQQLARDAAPFRIVMLLPANRTEQSWWQLMVEPFRDRAGSVLKTEFLPGRMRFLKPGQTAVGPNERPPFGVVLLVWQSGLPNELRFDPDEVRGGLFG